MDRNSPRPEGFIPDLGVTPLMIVITPLLHPDTCFILIQKGREMVTAGMRVNTLHSWTQQL
ncbi:MAG: hypothetical protein CM15mP47_0830 [Methanobacteriota archaeon]|nr:MAG: hypothetical protein CM15mP47_0830 [Euryarchaeota archaeon]